MSVDFTRPVTTRDGRSVRILCRDRKGSDLPIVGLVSVGEEKEEVYYWTSDGHYFKLAVSKYDLINPPTKKYIVLYKDGPGHIYRDDRESAERDGKKHPAFVRVIEVEI